MTEPVIEKVKITRKKGQNDTLTKDHLQKMSQEELIERILKLQAHNVQLQRILQKKNSAPSEMRGKKKFDFSNVSMRHVFLKFYYFGWDYQGYVVQEDTENTIEHYLFAALQKCCLIKDRESSNYHRCGRTDKGVSAFSQVISIDLRSKLCFPDESNVDQELPYCSMLNRLLPDNIRCYSWCHVPNTISSRFNCSWRTYKYYFPRGNLNISSMQEGAKYLTGTHDFRNFCKMDVGNGVTEYTREIQYVSIRKSLTQAEDPSGYEMYEFEICGRGFLWHQIRCIMSVLLSIGQGQESPLVVNSLLDINEHPTKPQYSLASHLPLNLFNVAYDNVTTNWVVDKENIQKILETLQTQWTNHNVKCVMIKDFIAGIEKLNDDSRPVVQVQAECLLEGVKPKVYKPLLTRMKCESLENKINHYVKRRKLEIVKEESSL